MKNTTIIIFGATGDLARRKLIPALYRLVVRKKLEHFVIIGAAFDDVTADQMLERGREFIPDIDKEVWKTLLARTFYKKINFIIPEDFEALKSFIQNIEAKHNLPGNRLFYAATASDFFCPITHNSARSGLAKRHGPKDTIWHRMVYEKPFGFDYNTAHETNECIAKWLDESQIYRIDHYLTKEIVNNIAMIRFTNIIFEPLWSNRYIDQVQIILSEDSGIDDRGGYYDRYGVLRDMVQNHMLELLALICMEAPEKLTGNFIREQRAKVLEKVRFVDGILGQYEGYKKEKHVTPNSHTETFASLYLTVDNLRWSGVPFFFKTGKYLDKKETVIHIKFKQVDCLLLRGCPMESNWLTIKVAPDATFLLTLNAKHPEHTNGLIPVGMEFCHSCFFGVRTPEAYEILIEEVIKGEQSISVRFDEIEYAWKLVDTIIAKNLPMYYYQKGSRGPKEEEKEMFKKHGMGWRS